MSLRLRLFEPPGRVASAIPSHLLSPRNKFRRRPPLSNMADNTDNQSHSSHMSVDTRSEDRMQVSESGSPPKTPTRSSGGSSLGLGDSASKIEKIRATQAVNTANRAERRTIDLEGTVAGIQQTQQTIQHTQQTIQHTQQTIQHTQQTQGAQLVELKDGQDKHDAQLKELKEEVTALKKGQNELKAQFAGLKDELITAVKQTLIEVNSNKN